MDRYAGIGTGVQDIDRSHRTYKTYGGAVHYDLSGRAVDAGTPGLHIVRRADGTTAKVLVR